jgi:hypothetical protein
LGCSSLANVTIGNGVTSIEDNAFYNWNLASITVDSGNLYYASEDGILYNKEKTEFILIPKKISGNITIPDSITSIGDCAFSSCTSLTGVTIGNGVTSIEDGYIDAYGVYGVFSGCTSLTRVTIPDGVTSIGKYAFSDCTSLANITIPDSVTSIGDRAFSGCTSLANITIPDSVTSIGEYAFSGCTSLANVTIGNSVTSIENYAFYGCTSLTSVTFQGTIPSSGFDTSAYGYSDLRDKYLAGGIGTYTTSNPGWNAVWTKQ